MENYGLVIPDDQSFMARVVELGVQNGILTRDRADEIVRISVAMSNKYVIQKEIDFRSLEQLARVQQTVLKLVGMGLEIKSEGSLEVGVKFLVEVSPVELFRLAYTRTENLRNEWKKLLLNHQIPILVDKEQYSCLSDIACQILSEMSVFTESELYAIQSLKLDDELFTSLTILEYYESELRRYQFILKLRDILPFQMLNKSPLVNADNLSEVDSIREALINTLVISGFLETETPVVVTTDEVRAFIGSVDWLSAEDPFPVEIESTVIDVIHELGQGLQEEEASLLAKEVISSVQNLVTTIAHDWKTVNSPLTQVFLKRWARLAILSDTFDEFDQLGMQSGKMDEFEYENLINKMARMSEAEMINLLSLMSWEALTPDQIIRLFHDFGPHHGKFVEYVSLREFSGAELIDLMETIEPSSLKELIPKIKEALASVSLDLEDMEVISSIGEIDSFELLRASAPPQLEKGQALLEFRYGNPRIRKILFHSCIGAEFFHDLFLEAWNMDPHFVKREVRSISPREIGRFLELASGRVRPAVVAVENDEFQLQLTDKDISNFFDSLPTTKKKAAIRHFLKLGGAPE
jgi:hypothetical protein